MRRGRYGDGTLDERGPDIWRLRYWAGSKRVSKTFRGSKRDAQNELRKLIRLNDTGEHVAPDRMTLGQWVEKWLVAGAPGRKKRPVGRRSLERYAAALRLHVVPTLGATPLQKLQSEDIDALYRSLKGKLTERGILFLNVVLNSCLETATRGRKLARNPLADLETKPTAPASDHGLVLDRAQLIRLENGFRGHPLHPIVVTAIHTACRRNELLALRWGDLDIANRTLRIERSLERTRGNSAVKAPKTNRGVRTIKIGEKLLALLLAHREQHLRIAAGVVDSKAPVDLSLVRLPDDALMFPGTPREGAFSFVTHRNPNSVTKTFSQHARKLGFPKKLRFHDLRGSNITMLLLGRNTPIHVIAQRAGHDVAVMMEAYAKYLPQADQAAADEIDKSLKGAV
jgi:integrase